MEALGCLNGVLTCQRVSNKECFLRLGDFSDIVRLVHHLLVEGRATRRIEDDNIKALKLGRLERALGNIYRKLAFNDWQRRHANLLSQNSELLHRRRTAHVERGEKNFLALFFLQALGKFTGCGRLTGTLKTGHHDDSWRRVDFQLCRCAFFIFAAQHLNKSIMDDFDDHLARRDRFDHRFANSFFANLGDKVFYNWQRDVGFKKSDADFTHCIADIFL